MKKIHQKNKINMYISLRNEKSNITIIFVILFQKYYVHINIFEIQLQAFHLLQIIDDK